MRRSRAGRWFLACSALVLCSGCFDLLQEIWLEPGGGGRLRLEVSLPKSLLSMARMSGDDVLIAAREDAANAKAELAKDPDIRRFDYRSEEEPGVFKLIYEVESNDARKLQAASARALAAVARRAQGGKSGPPVDFTVDRKYGLAFELKGSVGGVQEGQASSPENEIGKAMAGAMLGGHAITVRLHAPVILSTNGTLDAARTTAEWKVPLSALVEPGFRQELSAEALAVDWKVVAVGVAAALVLFGLVLGRLTARRR